MGIALSALLFFISALALVGGVYFVKRLAQQNEERRYYRVTLPEELSAEEVAEWLTSISDALRSHPLRALINAEPTLTFEVHATSSGFTHSMRVPWRQAKTILQQLQAKIPGIYAERLDHPQRSEWSSLGEYGETHPEHTLNIPNPTALAIRLLAAMSSLKDGEEVLMQWVISAPAISKKPLEAPDRDQLEDQRNQLNELNLSAVLRVATKAETEGNAKQLQKQLISALGSTRTAHNSWRKRMVPRRELENRIERAMPAYWPASRLKVSELSGVIGWANDPSISGMPRGHARVISASNAVPSEGLVIGTNPSPSRERKVAIPFKEALTHTWIGGRTGVGKTSLLSNMSRQIMAAGYGLVLFEAEGDLYEKVVNYVPRERLGDVIAMDYSDLSSLVAFNPLDQGNPSVVIDELIELFDHQFDNSMWAEEFIANGLRTLGESKEPMSIIDLIRLVSPRNEDEVAWGNEVIKGIEDVELRDWWGSHKERGKEARQSRADPVLSRMNQFIVRPELRYVFGQPESAFQMKDVLTENKILLVNLKGVSSKTVSLVGTMMINSLWHAARTSDSDRPTYLMLDEFKDFMDMPVNFETLLSQARKRNLGLVLANQHLKQLTKETQEGILANARNKIVMQSTADDAKIVLREMGSNLAERDIVNLERFHALADIQTGTGSSGAFTVRTLPEAQPENMGHAALAASRTRYGRPASEVKHELLNRYKAKENPRRPRPKVSGEGFFEAIGKDD